MKKRAENRFLKLLIFMKLTVLLIMLNFLHLSASVYSQVARISLEANNIPLKEVFRQIEQQSEFHFFYNTAEINTGREVNIRFKEADIDKILQEIFRDDASIGYKIIDRHIVLFKYDQLVLPGKSRFEHAERSLVERQADAPTSPRKTGRIVTGVVRDAASGLPLIGVNIVIKGYTVGTISGMDGSYSIEVVQPDAILVFTYVGYTTQEEMVGDRTLVNVLLRESIEKLDEVVVIGYGTQKRRDLTGAVGSISSATLQKVPVRGIDQALKGQISGVLVTENSGSPGAVASIRIRGNNSISANNNPLFIVDGFQVDNIRMINPGSIETIDILKDASSTAIYGSRGANGVVIITTKRGKAGRSNIDFDYYYGVREVRKRLDMLNASEFVMIANEAVANSNIGLNPSSQTPLPYNPELDYGKGTDWQNLMFRIGHEQNASLTFSGGDESTRYMIMGNYFSQEGIIIGSDFERASVRMNLDRKMSNRFHVNSNIFFSRTGENYIDQILVRNALVFSPLVTVKDSLGNYTLRNQGYSVNNVSNPVADALEKTDKRVNTYTQGNIDAQYKISEYFRLDISLAGELRNYHSYFYAPRTTLQGFEQSGSASMGKSQHTQWQNVNTLNYNRAFGRHSLAVMAGFTLQEWKNESMNSSSREFLTDALEYKNLGDGYAIGLAQIAYPSSGFSSSSLFSSIGRFNYILLDRYMFTFTISRDGSSKFGQNNQFGTFPSAAIAWRVSDEPFMDNLDFISNLKFRTSYGSSGKDAISNYQIYSTYGTYGAVFGYGANKTIAKGYALARLPNPDLKWETTYQLNIGLDMGFLNNRITSTFDVYHKTTRDLLLQVTLPYSSGFRSAFSNIGSVENKGCEFQLITRNLEGNFKWTTNFNVTYNKSKILELGEVKRLFLGGSGEIILREGGEFGEFYGYEMIGIFQNQEEIANEPALAGTLVGHFKYKDLDDDKKITPETDRKVIGKGTPDYFGGIVNDFYYKNFELSIFFQGIYGVQVYSRTRMEMEDLSPRNNKTKAALDRWVAPGSTNSMPRAYKEPIAYAPSTHFLEDGAFLQLRNLTLAYNLPAGKIKWCNSFKFYLTGQNLFTWTRYSGYDPEVNTYGDNTNQFNVDYAPYPKSKLYMAGFNIGF